MNWKGRLRELSLRWGGYRALRDLERFVLHRAAYRRELDFFGPLVRPGALCFDVGANRGQSSETFLALGARVVAFEPQADLHRELRARCARMGDFVVRGEALGASVERRTLFLSDYDQIASMKEGWQGTPVGAVDVAVSTLDAQIAEHGRPDYCKIDVEGWELETLRGLSQALPLVSLEYHLEAQDLAKTRACIEHLMALSRCSVNVRPADAPGFLHPSFVSAAEFLATFPQPALPRPPGYGDLFVRSL